MSVGPGDHGDDRTGRVGQGQDVMVEALQSKAVKVGEIPRDVDLCEHSYPRLAVDCAAKPAVDQQDAVFEPDISSDERLVGFDVSSFQNARQDRSLLGSVNRVPFSKSAKVSRSPQQSSAVAAGGLTPEP